ncbi:MAG: cation diffusion facilitator family transporter [Alphaproteobacteria bacterium]|nr:cation diffusion facilitator family transporter [Alphaproteobacteria bacterium]
MSASPHATLMQRTAWVAVCVAVFLVALKFVAYIVTDSIAMMASLADSALDVFASAVNLLAVRHALEPADAEHRFGHGKAEPLAGLMQGAFISGSVVFLLVESSSRLYAPHPIEHGAWALIVMGVSIAITIALVVLQRITVKRTGSLAIGADSAHYTGDVLTNLGVVAGVVLSTQFGWLIADPLIGMAVAAALAFSAWHVLRQSYDQLMDRELAEDDREKIKAIVMRHPEVRGIHDLRTRAAGIHTFIQFHLELDPAVRLTQAHRISDAVEAEVMDAFPNAEILIHQDPEGVEELPELART